MKALRVVAQLTFLNAIRSRILQTLVAIALLLLLANFFVIELFNFDIGKVSTDYSLSAISLIGLLIILFVVIRHLSDDTEHHYAYFILARPVNKWEYLLGKYLAYTSVLGVTVLLLSFGSFAGYLYTLWKFPGHVSPTFSWGTLALSILLQFEALSVLLAVTFFWVSSTRESFTALFLTVCTYLIGQNMVLLRSIITLPSEDGGHLINNILAVVSWLFPNLSFFDLKTVAAYGLHFEIQNILFTILYGVSYIGITLFFAIFFFNRKEYI